MKTGKYIENMCTAYTEKFQSGYNCEIHNNIVDVSIIQTDTQYVHPLLRSKHPKRFNEFSSL